MQTLGSIKDLSKHKDSLGLHFGHRWPLHFGCVCGFSGLCHAFFGRDFSSKHGAYWWSSSHGGCPCYFGHFVLMCNLSTFLFPINNTSFFFLLVSFGRFRQENYVGMWGHYGSRIVGVFLGPFNEASNLIINIIWWYMPFIYGRLCPIFFLRGSILVASYLWFKFCIFDRPILKEYVS